MTEVLSALEKFAAKFKVAVYDEKRYAGDYRILQQFPLKPSERAIAQHVPAILQPYVERNDEKVIRIAVKLEKP